MNIENRVQRLPDGYTMSEYRYVPAPTATFWDGGTPTPTDIVINS
jgi:hypothetical protein